ncbi:MULTISPECIES: type VII secretion protein EccE [Mycolicibacterium]|jgi:type VII secretion protein EccE|uniref:Conserved membrane protein n=5 Tax=Mycolicibacterium TaxID=1866885 RepID=A1T192_MYCVP|nr:MULTISPECIES: type VII secretion protein EccE [Mycolicibacterium]ABM10942.1 putative conserved membrane protein [Mycolicibacterium vanbaalenii PYR-1]MDN4516448.1 type VII secretion protein EccE [Mycolicibacterium austroafricanum]MDW5610069.1 type VII secretion protein EccE [Mycolicibacterium sp. D5.8-2]PQP44492.1 type VII secretion protein EccE [Mycolicibacterium austroafricanum]QRZ07100.1 type VII secretion protein EccE [Mycolicibacterium austroafricanum]
MSRFASIFGLRFTTGHALWAAALIPACILVFARLELLWLGITLGVLIGLASVVTIRGRRLTGWVAALFAWRRRHRQPPPTPSEPAVGATVIPGDHVALRWQDDYLVSVIELVPRPFTPTVIVNGEAFTDDVVETRLVEDLLTAYCPDLEADIVSAGYRVGKTAPAALVALYEQVVGPYPAPASRRTWIVLRADPDKTRKSALRRNEGVAGLAQYLVSSTTRIADHLASKGVDARPARSFDDFDRATEISFERETWSMVKGRSTFTAAYHAPGGPDVWWSARADHTLTRMRIVPGSAPTTTVLLTTLANPSTPRGFSCLFGGQRAALLGENPVTDRHYELPIGSAGVLVGETADRYPVYMPFDDVDVSINLGNARLFTQFVVRSAAAGAAVTLQPQFEEFAGFVNARIGQVAKVAWPHATTYLRPHPGVGRVMLRDDFIATPRHKQLPIRLINPREESRYQMVLEP